MKPAPPVTTVLGIQQIPNPKSEIRNQKSQILVGDSTLEDAADEREPHDLQVERDRPVLNVIEVVLDPLLERGVAPPAVDLRPAGDAGFHFVTQHVLRNAMLELLDEERTLGTGADDGHVALQDVPELG